MQIPEPSDNWLTVGTVLGTLAAAAVVAFAKVYSRAREETRAESLRSPDVAANAIGAAFVDRSTAQAIAGIEEDVRALRRLAEEREQHESEDRLLERLEERLKPRT